MSSAQGAVRIGTVLFLVLLGACAEETPRDSGDVAGTTPLAGAGVAGTAAGTGVGGTASGTGGTTVVGGTGGTSGGVGGAGGIMGGAGGTLGGAGGMMAGAGGTTGGTGGTLGGAGGMMAGAGGTSGGAGGMMAGTGGMMASTGGMMAGTGGMMAGTGGAGGAGGTGGGSCCMDGDCLCHGDPPSSPTRSDGPYNTDSYSTSAGCIYYPTNGEPPYAAVAVSDGFLGSGGCSSFQTGQWGDFYASWGIVTMIISTGSSDQPNVRGRKLGEGIAAFKAENEDSGSPLFGLLAGRYGTSGFSMGGGGTTYAASDDPTLLTNVAIMPWGPTSGSGITVPSLVICGSSDGTAPCSSHGTPFYNAVPDSTPKMKITISSGHAGQPTSGGGASGEAGLAFQKVYLENDERWLPILKMVTATDTNIN